MTPELHADAVAALAGWSAPDAQQEALRVDYLRRLEDGPVALTRHGRPDHLTASAVVLDRDGRHVCLVLHNKVRRWLQPGGHCEAGDATLVAAAVREAVEETGVRGLAAPSAQEGPLRLDRHAAPCARDARHHLDVQYLLVAPDRAEVEVSEESLDVAWWPVDALPDGEEGVDDAVRTLVAAGVQAHRTARR